MKKMLVSGIATSLILIGAGISTAQDFSKSSKEWNRKAFHKIETPKEVDELPKESQIAMACSKCKSVTMMIKKEAATKPGHGTVEEALMVDQCPGCGGKITTKANGKETAMIHTCSQCGDDSAYCCATTPGEKTHGMSDK